MARIRTIKPEMAQDEDLASCSAWAQLLAVRLLNQADDEGYFKANPALIKSNCFPLITDDSLNIHGVITELSNIGYISLHEGSDGRAYGFITNFTRHQKINRPTPSHIKGLVTLTESSVSTHGVVSDDSLGKGKERKGKERRQQADVDLSLSDWMSEKLKQLNPTMKPPNREAWADEFRKIRTIDGRTETEIRAQFSWANADSFWQANILSPATLRKQWDKLTLQRRRKGNGTCASADDYGKGAI